MNCGREGSLSLLVLVPAGQVMDVPDTDAGDPVSVHLTVCRSHLRGVRNWLRARTPEEPISCSTDYLMRHWGQIVEDGIGLPVWGMADIRQAAG